MDALIIATVTAMAWAAQRHPDRVARWKRLTVRELRSNLVDYWYHRWYLPHRSLVSRVLGCLRRQPFFVCDCCCLELGGQDLDVEYHAACQCSNNKTTLRNGSAGEEDGAIMEEPSAKYCRHCIAKYLENQVLEGGKTQLQCLLRKCPLDDRLIRKRLTVSTTRIYDRALIFEAVAATQNKTTEENEKLWQCPATDCDFVGFISNQISPRPPSFFKQLFWSAIKQENAHDPRRIRCPLCQIASCHFCHTVWSKGVVSHDNLTCPTYAQRLAQTDDDQKLLQQWKHTAQTQVCPSPHCQNTIEKNAGCNHVACRCGHHFCWVCGEEWSRQHSYQCRNYRTRDVARTQPPNADPRTWWERWFAW